MWVRSIMIKLFRVGSMVHTPFSQQTQASPDQQFFENQDIVISSDLEDSDILISQNIRDLYQSQKQFGFKKKYFIWTHEPRYNTNYTNKLHKFFWKPPIYIMNVYTGDIYVNNYTIPFIQPFFRNYWEMDNLPLLKDSDGFKAGKKIVAVMYCRNYPNSVPLLKNGKNIDLYYLRSDIAFKGHQRGIIDIYGGNWPEGVAKPNQSSGPWYISKKDILKNYSFNLCFENTNTDYYVSEKIWDSIRYGCLPIYYGKDNKIYEDFPAGSFIDYCDFDSPDHLFDYIEAMTVAEYRERMNLCIEVFNRIIKIRKETDPYQEMLDRTVTNICSIMDSK